MGLNEIVKSKRFRYIIASIVVIVIIASIIGWTTLKSENEFNITVLNLSGKELMVYLHIGNTTESGGTFGDLFEVFVTTNGIDDNESRTYTYDAPCKDIIVGVRTRNDSIGEEKIAQEAYYFQGLELYDLLVILQDSGERITITKMP